MKKTSQGEIDRLLSKLEDSVAGPAGIASGLAVRNLAAEQLRQATGGVAYAPSCDTSCFPYGLDDCGMESTP